MRAPLNRAPRGLLDFFNIKTNGQNPSDLSQVVAPTLEMLPWFTYAQAGWTRFLHQFTAPPAGYYAWLTTDRTAGEVLPDAGLRITVPTNETWLILEYETIAISDLVGTNTVLALPGFEDTNIGGTIMPHSEPAGLGTATAALAANIRTHVNRFPYFVRPGVNLGVVTPVFQATGPAPSTLIANVRLIRCLL